MTLTEEFNRVYTENNNINWEDCGMSGRFYGCNLAVGNEFEIAYRHSLDGEEIIELCHNVPVGLWG